jgi:hypothetical protein
VTVLDGAAQRLAGGSAGIASDAPGIGCGDGAVEPLSAPVVGVGARRSHPLIKSEAPAVSAVRTARWRSRCGNAFISLSGRHLTPCGGQTVFLQHRSHVACARQRAQAGPIL